MLSIIVAFDKNQLIGKDNAMPWHYPADLKYFKEKTLHKTVVMGSHTYNSILSSLKKPLPDRHLVVMTRNPEAFSGVETYSSLERFLDVYQTKEEEIFIIGGKMIYEQFLPLVNRLYITHIDQEFLGNVYFPPIEYAQFDCISETKVDDLRFCVYERKVTGS
jgi:dihydrofolate reductase